MCTARSLKQPWWQGGLGTWRTQADEALAPGTGCGMLRAPAIRQVPKKDPERRVSRRKPRAGVWA